MAQALWVSAVVVYARCFGSGSRTVAPRAALDELTQVNRDTHRRIWRERDKYVAHVELTREEIHAVERIVNTRSAEILGHQVQFRRVTHDIAEVQRLIELTTAIRRFVAVSMTREFNALRLPMS